MARRMGNDELMDTLFRSGIGGEALEALIDLTVVDNLGAGELGNTARLGMALSQIGSDLMAHARDSAAGLCGPDKMYRFEFVDGGVHFTYRAPYSRHTANVKRLEQEHPKAECPEYWNESQVKETIAISLE